MHILKSSGVISQSKISFSFSNNKENSSYSIFGGINENQIHGELFKFSNYENKLNLWAIEAEGLIYSNEVIKTE